MYDGVKCQPAGEVNQQLVREPTVLAYLAAGCRSLDPDPPELGHRRHEVGEEGALVGRVVVDRAARPRVGVEHLVGAQEALAALQVPVESVVEVHRRGVEEGEGVGVGAAGAVHLRLEAGVHGPVADPILEEGAVRGADAVGA